MNNKFLNKVCDQIISETRVIDDKVYIPCKNSFGFSPSFSLFSLRLPVSPSSFFSHCKDVYSLNEQEIDYVWNEYKKGVTTLINDKEPSHQEKG